MNYDTLRRTHWPTAEYWDCGGSIWGPWGRWSKDPQEVDEVVEGHVQVHDDHVQVIVEDHVEDHDEDHVKVHEEDHVEVHDEDHVEVHDEDHVQVVVEVVNKWQRPLRRNSRMNPSGYEPRWIVRSSKTWDPFCDRCYAA